MPVLLEPSVKIAYYLMIIAFISIPVEVLHRVVHDKKKGLRVSKLILFERRSVMEGCVAQR